MFSRNKGFTLIELLIVIGIIATLASAVIVAINPAQQFAAARDATRKSHLNSLYDAILSYQAENLGSVSELNLENDFVEICNTESDTDCGDKIDLSSIDEHINQIPVDPSIDTEKEPTKTGYEIALIDGEVTLTGVNLDEVIGGYVFECGDSLVDPRDNNIYKTVEIGDRCWMAENLAYLPDVMPSDERGESDPYYYVPGYEGSDVEEAKATNGYEDYGVLYNMYAALDGDLQEGSEGVCPEGWYVPTDEDWFSLELEAGVPEEDLETDWWRGEEENAGGSIAGDEDSWSDGDLTQTDNFGEIDFMGLPAGKVVENHSWEGGTGQWWTSTDYHNNAWRRELNSDKTGIMRRDEMDDHGVSVGLSLRCIKSQ